MQAQLSRFPGDCPRAAPGHLLGADPPDHIRLRTLVSKAFTPRSVERLRGRIQDVCDELLDTAAPERRLELVRRVRAAAAAHDHRRHAGDPRAGSTSLRRLDEARPRRDVGRPLADLLLGMPALWQSVALFPRAASRGAEPSPQDDMVTALLQAEEAGDKLSEDEVIGMIGLLLLAGFETTMGLIASGTLALLQHPEQRRRFVARARARRIGGRRAAALHEPLGVHALFRIAREDVTIGSVTIPKGDVVLAVLGSANRDESRFPSPDTLDLAREPNRHLAFGAGAHFCLGAPLARLEGRIAAHDALPPLPGPAPRRAGGDGALAPELVFRGPARLPLTF